MSKPAFWHFLNEIGDALKFACKSISVPIILQLCVALRVLSEGNSKTIYTVDFNLHICKTTLLNILYNIVSVGEQRTFKNWIQFPILKDEIKIKEKFFEEFKFPGIIGLVGQTDINISTDSTKNYSRDNED